MRSKKNIFYTQLLFAAFLVMGCGETINSRFIQLEQNESGIDFFNKVDHLPDQNIIEYMYHYNGGGVAVGDINNDGLEDIYLSANQGADQLYLNRGNLHFENITSKAGIIGTTGWSTGVTMADVNADGWLDIYVSQVGDYKSYKGTNLLFINNQNGTFTERGEEYGLNYTGFFTQSAFFDYDLDGDLDLFLLNHAVHTPRSYRPMDQPLPRDLKAGDYLLRNELNSPQARFLDVTESSGITSNIRGYGLGLSIADINGDGWPDIYVGNDFHENDYLYINNQDGTFADQLTKWIPHTSQFTMGVDVQDLNRDGNMDIFSVDMMPKDRSIRMKSGGEDAYKLKEAKLSYGFHPQVARNTLNINKGNGSFMDVAPMKQMFSTDWSWSILMDDLDNNGWSDVFISNGIYKRPNDLDYINFLSNYNLDQFSASEQDSIEKILIDQMPTLKIANEVFAQQGELNFEEVSEAWALNATGYSGATAMADFDLDGDLDIIVNNLNQPAWLFENTSSSDSSRHFISIELTKETDQTYIGSTIELYAGHQFWSKQLFPVRGFQSSGSHRFHVGLGAVTQLDSIVISLRNQSMTLYNQSADQFLTIDPKKLSRQRADFGKTKDQVSATTTNLTIPMVDYKDYNQEPLMPHRLSLLNRPYVVADFDQDGRQDVFIGGNMGIPAVIWYQDATGELINKGAAEAFELDAFYIDAACSAADFNGDGMLDLYIVSGGNRYPEGSRWLEDRLYLGIGKGRFQRLKIDLPRTNSISATAADYDKDGDMDLFIGSLNTPGAYGYSPPSFLLQNNGGGLMEIAQVVEAGMITDAQWYQDEANEYRLATVGEWEPLRIWEIGQQGLQIAEESEPFENHLGWYRSLKIHDFNKDGKPDFLLGNIGFNTTLSASTQFPVQLYLDDFDQNGQPDPIISYYISGKELPLASKDMLVAQLPVLKKDYISYKAFSEINGIPELLGALFQEENVQKKKVTQLGHLVFMSTDTSYRTQILPEAIQVSPILSIHVSDINEDGLDDLLIGGNYLDPVSMIGQLDANALSIIYGSKSQDQFFDNVEYLKSETVQIRMIDRLSEADWIAIPFSGNALRIQKVEGLQ